MSGGFSGSCRSLVNSRRSCDFGGGRGLARPNMSQMKLAKTALLLSLAGSAAFAQGWQNSDFSFLFGGAHVQGQVVATTIASGESTVPLETTTISGSAGFATQLNFGHQITATKAGALYLEFPITFLYEAAGVVQGTTVTALNRNVQFFAPGVRFKLPAYKRVSFYGALGVGWQLATDDYIVINGQVTSTPSSGIRPVLGAGGGIDLRISRWLSLRLDARDYVTFDVPSNVFSSGHNHVWVLAGFAFHL